MPDKEKWGKSNRKPSFWRLRGERKRGDRKTLSWCILCLVKVYRSPYNCLAGPRTWTSSHSGHVGMPGLVSASRLLHYFMSQTRGDPVGKSKAPESPLSSSRQRANGPKGRCQHLLLVWFRRGTLSLTHCTCHPWIVAVVPSHV